MARHDSPRDSPLTLVEQSLETTFYADLVARSGAPVLILGCGHGRLVWDLCAAGHRVVGVDPSERMVAIAEERRSEEPLASAEKARFAVADLRALRLGERFATVIAPANALGLLFRNDDLEATFATIATHLVPEGLFAFDVPNPGRSLRTALTEAAPLSKPQLHARATVLRPHLREGRERSQPGALHRLKVRHFAPSELDATMGAVGLVATERYGDFKLTPYLPEHRLQVVVGSFRG